MAPSYLEHNLELQESRSVIFPQEDTCQQKFGDDRLTANMLLCMLEHNGHIAVFNDMLSTGNEHTHLMQATFTELYM